MLWTICASNLGCGHIFVFPKSPRSALGPIQPRNRWMLWSSGWGVKLTPCLHLVLRLKNGCSFTSSTLYAFFMCTAISSPFYLSRLAVIWLRYEPWILNTSIEHSLFSLLHCVYCQVIQSLHQPLHIYKIYKIYTFKMLRHVSVPGPSSGSYIVLAKVTL